MLLQGVVGINHYFKITYGMKHQNMENPKLFPLSEMENNLITPEAYIRNRVEDQIKWYSAKSAQNQKRYFQIRTIQLLMLVCIPIFIDLGGLLSNLGLNFIRGALIFSVCVLFLETISINFRYYELWLEYRSIGSILQRELYLYKTRSGPYQIEGPNMFNDFVLTVERIMWNNSQNKK